MKNERVVIILSEMSHIHWKWEKNIYTNCLYYNEAVKNEKKKNNN